MEYNIGDHVQLKGNFGPVMVIINISMGNYLCVWFDNKNHLHSIEVMKPAIEKVTI